MRMKSLVFFLGMIFSSAGIAAECKQVTPAEFAKQSVAWRGRTLIATASWCSSCKSKLMDAQKKPDDYVILVAFDKVKPMELVLDTFKIAAPCIVSDDLVEELKIDALPWQSKI